MILNEFDKDKCAIIEPYMVEEKIEGFPKIGVSCFSEKVVKNIVSIYSGEIISYLKSANGEVPIYKIIYENKEIAIFMSRVGAPACTVFFEEMIAKGLEKLVLVGSCGVLDNSIECSQIIIPTSAIRDEGTSYHYIEESDEIELDNKCISILKETIKSKGYTYMVGKTWTTDAPYRETRAKASNRKEQGCICVEMECSAMASVAKFRDVVFTTFFHAADNLDNITWEPRGLAEVDHDLSQREKLMLLACECAINI